MPELIRSIAARLREFVGNNRRAPRRGARLPMSVAPLDGREHVTGARNYSTLRGHTRDVSATGLGFVVPAIHIGGNYLTGENRKLQISLDLPSEPIQINAAPVRYERLDEADTDTGYLIGAHITEMSDPDRTRFTEYLRSLR
ncbi:MAG TPA: PilZ domain-containing protein [Pyrinomonadaceae bacterium]|nr:PilZ domain-containing protein [Pyrinomonadaceae bacterium]